jgi:hypothetical protein
MTVYEGIRSGRPLSALILPVVFPLFHLCYGVGMIMGLCSCKWKQEPAGEAEVSIRRTKEFGWEWDIKVEE